MRLPNGAIGEMRVNVRGGMATRLGNTDPGEPRHVWNIAVEDPKTHVLMFELEFTAEQFAGVLGNLYTHDVKLDVGNPAVWGTTLENETIEITLSREDRFNEDLIREIAADYATDGWIVRDDFRNMHRRTEKGYSIHRHRYVDAEGNPVIL